MALRGAPSPPGLKQSGPRHTNNLWTEPATATAASTSLPGGDTEALEAQIAQLTAELQVAEANLAQAQSALAIAQAQIASDTITIASLNAEVDAAEAQVVALQAQLAALAGRATYLYYPSLVEVLDNLYVPPYFVDDIVNATNAYLINKPVYYASLTIPTSGWP